MSEEDLPFLAEISGLCRPHDWRFDSHVLRGGVMYFTVHRCRRCGRRKLTAMCHEAWVELHGEGE